MTRDESFVSDGIRSVCPILAAGPAAGPRTGAAMSPAPPIPAGERAAGLAFRDLAYPLPITYLTVDNPGLELALSDTGPGTSAPALLLLHGLGSYLPAWSRNVPALAAHHRVVAIDLPGYGKSAKGPYPYTMDFFAGVVDRVIGALGLGRVALCGHSMGAQIAMTHALLFPGRAERLLLLAPAGLEAFTGSEARWLAAAVSAESVQATPVAGIHANLANNFCALPEEARFMAEDRVRVVGGPDFDGYARAVSASVRGMLDGPVLHRLEEIRAPALLLFGEEDRLIPNPVLHPGQTTRALAQAAAARFPDARLVFVPRAGHMLHFERPDAVNQALLAELAAP